MADSYSQLYVHLIFPVKDKTSMIPSQYKNELYKYITGIITNKGQKLIAINGMPDHVHILIGFKPTIAISDMVRDIKANSAKFVNEQKWLNDKFQWQHGFGAFTCGYSQLNSVCNYIRNQEEHHRKTSFKLEYLSFLKEHDVSFKSEYVFDE
jgi:putative transposase